MVGTLTNVDISMNAHGPIDDSHLQELAECLENYKEYLAHKLLTGETIKLYDLEYDLDNVLEDLTCLEQFKYRFRSAEIAMCYGNSEPLLRMYQESANRIAENIVDEYIEYIAESRSDL